MDAISVQVQLWKLMSLDMNQIIFKVNLDIVNTRHNIINTINDA